ncbi:hypothetical protein C8J56DRAFT_1042339 [Mycena floridula]|nr:hypothetical protein C8J56DRAFT_1042339 [Mycena floridula]
MPWAFWKTLIKMKKGSAEEAEGISVLMYDREDSRMLVFPHSGHLAYPGGLTSALQHFRAPVPPYNFVFCNQQGELQHAKPSHWIYLTAIPEKDPGNEAIMPEPGDLPPLVAHGQLETEWIDGNSSDSDDLPMGRVVAGEGESLPVYPGPAPPSFVSIISEASRVPATSSSSTVNPSSSGSGTAFLRQASSPDTSPLELASGGTMTIPLSSSCKGKRKAMDKEEADDAVSLGSADSDGDIAMGMEGDVLQINDSNMDVNEEGFLIIDVSALPVPVPSQTGMNESGPSPRNDSWT